MFTPRLTPPNSGNKYYNTKPVGGYSTCIIGNANPFTPAGKQEPKNRKGLAGMNVLPNCVGYAIGRFNEIGDYRAIKYTAGGNAENLFANLKAKGLASGDTPKLGALIVWQKGNTLSGSDGAGHIAVVEKIVSDDEIVVSQSGWTYNKGAMWTATHKKGADGQWIQGGDYNWMKNGYKFLGFIYNPAVVDLPEGVVEFDVKLDGKVVKCLGISKGGNWYIKLRDLDEKLHLGTVTWEAPYPTVKTK